MFLAKMKYLPANQRLMRSWHIALAAALGLLLLFFIGGYTTSLCGEDRFYVCGDAVCVCLSESELVGKVFRP